MPYMLLEHFCLRGIGSALNIAIYNFWGGTASNLVSQLKSSKGLETCSALKHIFGG